MPCVLRVSLDPDRDTFFRSLSGKGAACAPISGTPTTPAEIVMAMDETNLLCRLQLSIRIGVVFSDVDVILALEVLNHDSSSGAELPAVNNQTKETRDSKGRKVGRTRDTYRPERVALIVFAWISFGFCLGLSFLAWLGSLCVTGGRVFFDMALFGKSAHLGVAWMRVKWRMMSYTVELRGIV